MAISKKGFNILDKLPENEFCVELKKAHDEAIKTGDFKSIVWNGKTKTFTVNRHDNVN